MTKYGDEVATCGQNSEFEDHLQLEGGSTPPSGYESAKADSVTIFRGPHATRHRQSEEISVFTGIFRRHGKSSTHFKIISAQVKCSIIGSYIYVAICLGHELKPK